MSKDSTGHSNIIPTIEPYGWMRGLQQSSERTMPPQLHAERAMAGDMQSREGEGMLSAIRSDVTFVLASEKSQEVMKYDDGKLPVHLLPFDALEAITEILAYGAKKYSARRWEKGMDWSRIFRAALSHLWAWWLRKGNDAETGKSHLWHAGCCILFLIAYELRNVGKDDRPNDSKT